jgi:arsenical pump membrane protein
MDYVAIGLLVAGLICVLGRALPAAQAGATLRRVLPLLVFLGTVIVLAELVAAAGVFEAVATRLAVLARGRYRVLFVLCVLLAASTTAVLNLDTTAVLLTPVMLALAGRLELDPLPMAMTTVWLANTASLLLPVSNLTNLLAADRVGLPAPRFAAVMWLPELASVAATALLLWFCYWRRARVSRYAVPDPAAIADKVLFRVAAAGCALFLAGILAGVPIGAASAGCAGLLVVAFAVRDRSVLRPGLLPWRLLVLVTGMFLVVPTVSVHGLDALLRDLTGSGAPARAAAAGAALSHVVNNPPAYLAGEQAIPAAQHARLLALLVGTNVGPVITPWASLATILWYERCHASAVRVQPLRFVLTGAALAVTAVAAAMSGLLPFS